MVGNKKKMMAFVLAMLILLSSFGGIGIQEVKAEGGYSQAEIEEVLAQDWPIPNNYDYSDTTVIHFGSSYLGYNIKDPEHRTLVVELPYRAAFAPAKLEWIYLKFDDRIAPYIEEISIINDMTVGSQISYMRYFDQVNSDTIKNVKNNGSWDKDSGLDPYADENGTVWKALLYKDFTNIPGINPKGRRRKTGNWGVFPAVPLEAERHNGVTTIKLSKSVEEIIAEQGREVFGFEARLQGDEYVASESKNVKSPLILSEEYDPTASTGDKFLKGNAYIKSTIEYEGNIIDPNTGKQDNRLEENETKTSVLRAEYIPTIGTSYYLNYRLKEDYLNHGFKLTIPKEVLKAIPDGESIIGWAKGKGSDGDHYSGKYNPVIIPKDKINPETGEVIITSNETLLNSSPYVVKIDSFEQLFDIHAGSPFQPSTVFDIPLDVSKLISEDTDNVSLIINISMIIDREDADIGYSSINRADSETYINIYGYKLKFLGKAIGSEEYSEELKEYQLHSAIYQEEVDVNKYVEKYKNKFLGWNYEKIDPENKLFVNGEKDEIVLYYLERKIESVDVNIDKTEYKYGENLDTSTLEVTVNYDDGNSYTIPYSEFETGGEEHGIPIEILAPTDINSLKTEDSEVRVITGKEGNRVEGFIGISVSSLADENEPIAKSVTIDYGATANAEEHITNISELPEGTTFEYKEEPNTEEFGTKTVVVIVSYKDGSKDEVTTELIILPPDVIEGSEEKPSEDYVKVTFLAGDSGRFTNPYSESNLGGAQTSYWVNKDAGKTLGDLPKPAITVNEGYNHTGWDKSDETVIEANLEVTATFKKSDSEQPVIGPYVPSDSEDPTNKDDENVPTEDDNGQPINKEDYVVIAFKALDNGTLKDTENQPVKVLSYLVNKDLDMSDFTAPTAKADEGYEVDKWEPIIPTSGKVVDKPVIVSKNGQTAYTDNLIVKKEEVVSTEYNDENFSSLTIKNQPSKIEYNEGETFDPTGMVVILTDSDGNTKEVKASELKANGIFLNPNTSTPLTKTNNNGQPVIVSKGGKFVSTNDLIVNNDGPVIPPQKDKDKYPINPLDPKVKVEDPGNLTPEEKQEVKDKVKDQLPLASGVTDNDIVVGNDGSVTVTYTDGSKNTLSGRDTVKRKAPLPSVDKTELKRSIDNGESTQNNPYYRRANLSDREELDNAIRDGKSVYNNPNATQAEVNAAKRRIDNAIMRIYNYAPPKPPVYPGYDDPISPEKLIEEPDVVEPDTKVKPVPGGKDVAYIEGYPDGTIRPNAGITRAEAAAMIARLLKLDLSDKTEAKYNDTPSAWYNEYINAVTKAGIMEGYPDGTFRPDDIITRGEFTQMISNFDMNNSGTNNFKDVDGHWAEDAIDQALANERIEGYPDGTFRPDGEITRAEAATILNRTFGRDYTELSITELEKLDIYSDLNSTHWGYYQMLEATKGILYR